MGILEDYEAAHEAFRTGAIETCDNAALRRHLSGLANQNNTNTGTQHRDIIRGLTINQMLLERHIDTLDKLGAKTQRLIIWLTVAAVVGTVVQTLIAVSAEARASRSQVTRAEIPPGVAPGAESQRAASALRAASR